MIKLYDARSGQHLGDITAEQLQFMRSQLEEESRDDQDYYLNQATIDLFELRSADAALVGLLRQILGEREDMDIRWEPA
jgi:hypothetical protein